MLLACFTPILICFIHTSCTFYAFSGTNLLTRCRSACSCFLLFLCFRKVTQEIFSELDNSKTEVPIFTVPKQLTWRESKRGSRAATQALGAGPGLAAPRGRVGPLASADSASLPIYSPSRENPKYPSHIPRKVPPPPSTPNPSREGSEALPGTLPEGEIIAGGFYITMPASKVICE